MFFVWNEKKGKYSLHQSICLIREQLERALRRFKTEAGGGGTEGEEGGSAVHRRRRLGQPFPRASPSDYRNRTRPGRERGKETFPKCGCGLSITKHLKIHRGLKLRRGAPAGSVGAAPLCCCLQSVEPCVRVLSRAGCSPVVAPSRGYQQSVTNRNAPAASSSTPESSERLGVLHH